MRALRRDRYAVRRSGTPLFRRRLFPIYPFPSQRVLNGPFMNLGIRLLTSRFGLIDWFLDPQHRLALAHYCDGRFGAAVVARLLGKVGDFR